MYDAMTKRLSQSTQGRKCGCDGSTLPPELKKTRASSDKQALDFQDLLSTGSVFYKNYFKTGGF
jgi:hypothetical protein